MTQPYASDVMADLVTPARCQIAHVTQISVTVLSGEVEFFSFNPSWVPGPKYSELR